VVTVSRYFQRFVFVLSLGVFAVLVSGFVLSWFGYLGVHAGQQDGAYRQMRVYSEALKNIQGNYVTEPNMNDVTNGALHGLLESLDADSSYLTATEYKIYKERSAANAAQVGLVVSKRFGYATVVTVTPGSPADKEHIADGDVIESIDGQSTREISLAVIRLMLEGKPGSTLQLQVVRPRKSDPDKVTLTRTSVPTAPLVQKDYENATILYLKPGALTQSRVDEVAAKIEQAGKSRKIILDLRDSAGGEMNQALRLANFFIEQGALATLEGQKVPKQSFTADAKKFLTAAPLEVLINRGSYGPAELVAAAIADSKRGDVVGERSFGEGSVQKTIELPDGAALLLTVAKYKSPSGKKIEDEAVTPTVAIGKQQNSLDDDDEPDNAKDDKTLNKALELLKAKKG
jgi:carboxyl-terminal processing protease